MQAEFLININRLGCGSTGGKVLLAVSGGVDSVVLARLFAEAKVVCGIAHCNFQLRGEESDGDEAFVRDLAAELGFVFHRTSFSTKAFAADHNLSTQMAARELRYSWFAGLAAEHGYQHVAVAHHADDQAETVLLNLVRGAGIRGLQGMPEVNGRIVRPLLFANRDQILAYAARYQLRWREDHSNSDDYYRRNRIRKHVVPVLKSINPSFERTVGEMSERLREVEKLISAGVEAWKKAVWSEEGDLYKISIGGLRTAVSPVYLLHAILEPMGFGYEQVKAIIRGLDGLSGKEFHSVSHLLVKDRDFLLIRAKSTSEEPEAVQEILPDIFQKPDDFQVQAGKSVACFDADLLKMPLKIRRWLPGDSFSPYGMNGRKKKVSDLLTDLKLDRMSKEGVRVLVDADGRIVWVVGLRGDHFTCVTPGTRRVAMVRLAEG